MNNPDQYGSVKKKSSASFSGAGPQNQAQMTSQNSQTKMDFNSPAGQQYAQQFPPSPFRENATQYQNGASQQIAQFRMDLNGKKKDHVLEINDQKISSTNYINSNDHMTLERDQEGGEENPSNIRKTSKQMSNGSKIKNLGTLDSKKSIQKSNSDSSDPQIIIQYNSEEDEDEEEDDNNEDEDEEEEEEDAEEEYKHSKTNHPLSQKNLNTNPVFSIQANKSATENKSRGDSMSQNNNYNMSSSPYSQSMNGQQVKASPLNLKGNNQAMNTNNNNSNNNVNNSNTNFTSSSNNAIQHNIHNQGTSNTNNGASNNNYKIGEKLMNIEKKKDNESITEEDLEEYNVQASSKVENKIQSSSETNHLFHPNYANHIDGNTNQNISGNQQNNSSNNANIKSSQGGYKINSLHLNNHEQYLQQQQHQTQGLKQLPNNPRSHSSSTHSHANVNTNYIPNTVQDNKNTQQPRTIFEKRPLASETQNTTNTPQNRLSVLEEKFSTEQSERLNDQQFTSYNTNWNQSISPDTKLNRFSNQQMMFNNKEQQNSFYKEKEIDHLESETNHNDNINQAKDKESLIQFDDANSKDNSQYNSIALGIQKRKNSHPNLDDHVNQRNSLNKESFDMHYSNKKDQMFLDSSHQLKELEENHLKRIISENSHHVQKKNLIFKDSIVSNQNEYPDNVQADLGKHMGKEINVGNNLNGNNNNSSNTNIVNIQGTLKQMQSERVNTKSSSQSKLQLPVLNKFELEQKKERKIQKFCQKFFKDLLKNRSGVPTLTQNNRKMNLDSETPNPDYNYKQQKQAKEGLLNEDLRKELFNIEEHQKYRLVMDQFLKKFNKNPKEAISFLIDNQLCDDSEEDIAYMLLTTEGLNKEQLGQFFGSNKEKNQKILEAFCGLMDFRNLRFDEAIRLFLSRFRLPGEAQQIDRIVQKFTKVYTYDNPKTFTDDDTPYILCYSAIMLNVDAHSEKIEKNKKMQKNTFVHNNLLCTKNAVSKEFLEELYDNIVKEKFETKVDYIEKIYSRVPIESMQKQFDGQNRFRIIKELQTGSNFLKYGRTGKPHMRKVYLNEKADRIVWNEVCEQVQLQILANTNQKVNTEKKYKLRHINIKDITDLTLGCNATEVMRRNKVPPEFDQFCFSIIASNRTLDLKCNDMETKNKWIAFIYNHLNDQRLLRKNKANLTPEQKQLNQERINEIWKVDIFQKWEDHWDYAASKPKFIGKYEDKANKTNFFSSICSCLSMSKNSNGKIKQVKHNNTSQSNSLNYASHKDYEELDLVNQSNKSLLLISLWKIGMPQWVRKTIWPLTIGNRLEITENLYKILLKQVQVSESNIGIANNQIMISIGKMKADLKNKTAKRFFSSFTEAQLTMLENVLSAFIFYRPDVGFITEAMPNIAAVLISQLDDEYTVFKCFINLLHSYHFLHFFRGEMSEIKWRVQFFNEYLQKRSHLVLSHFRALDLSSELFLMHWFLNLFSNVFDQETVLRIWDNFLLEGEVFAFKAGIAFIEYFHLEFKMATFDDAIKFLKNPPDDLYCADLYFDIVEDIKIPSKDFNDRLDQQNVAKLAPYILQQLLS